MQMIDLDSKMTGKSIKYVDLDVESFLSERPYDKELRLMDLEDYIDANKTNHRQIKRLTITGNRPPYTNKLIRIRIQFDDDYPKSPLKMFVEKTKGVQFLHANVYHDLGDICHPLLEPKKNGVSDSKFTYILKKINELLYSPNFNNPANITLSTEKVNDQESYFKRISENATLLDDSQYLSPENSDSEEDS